MKVKSVRNPEQFHRDIESRVTAGMDYIEAIVSYCEENGLEVESVTPLMKQGTILRAKLQDEAEKLNLIQKTTTLKL